MKFPNSESYNSEYFVNHILNELVEKKADIWGESEDGKKKIVTHLK